MTRVYLDTNYLFGLVRPGTKEREADYRAWRERVEAEIGADPPLISDLVADELAYRLVLAWLRDFGDQQPLTTFRRSTSAVMRRMRAKLSALWKGLDALDLDWATSRSSSLHIARSLMADPGLSPRDAFHAAYSIDNGCEWIVSSDLDFDRVPRLNRLGP